MTGSLGNRVSEILMKYGVSYKCKEATEEIMEAIGQAQKGESR